MVNYKVAFFEDCWRLRLVMISSFPFDMLCLCRVDLNRRLFDYWFTLCILCFKPSWRHLRIHCPM